MPADEENTYSFTVEDLVESRARGLASSLRMESRREKLAKANPALQGVTFKSGLS